MKLTAFLVIISLFKIQAKTYSQNPNVTLNFNQIEIGELFEEIQAVSDMNFLYNVNDIDLQRRVSVNVSKKPLSEVLMEVFKNTGVTFEIRGDQVIIFPLPPVTKKQIQEIISGKVTDEEGMPLIGATVLIKGTNIGTITNFKGTYSLQIDNPDAILVFSFVGYKTKEIPIDSRENIDVVLKEKVGELSEVVLIGYGTTTQRNTTGAVSTIESEVIEKQSVQNPMEALQARVPGLFIKTVSGRPGANMQVRIRGINSINSGNNPLYIIDGVPFNYQSPLNSIAPYNIESITVLKDASATAIYGSRGANGVILITTKDGNITDEMRMNINIQTGVGEVAKRMDLMNTKQYLEIRRRAFENDGIMPNAGNAPDLVLFDQNQYTDWQDLLIGNTANFNDVNISFTGGTTKNRFYLSGSYRTQTTVYPGDAENSRVGVHATYDYTSSNDKFGISFTTSYSFNNNKAYSGDFTSDIFTAPNLKPYAENGELNWEEGIGTYDNPLRGLYLNNTIKTNNLIGNATFNYKILNNLEAKLSLGYNVFDTDLFYGTYQKAFPPESTSKPSAQFGDTQRKNYIIEPQLNYNVDIGNGNLNALIGSTVQRTRAKQLFVNAYNYATDALLESMAAAGDINISNDQETDYRYTSVFGRLIYNWMGKYIVNGTFRRDGSSRFGKNNRYGNFGAVGLAWIFTEESFINNNLGFLTFGKLRSSYGSVGNDQIGDYQYLETWSDYYYSYQGIPSLAPQRLGNSIYSWERVKKFDIALELGFLDNNIRFTANFYKNRTDNQLVGLTLPSITGFTSIQYNLPAIVENRGWEFELNTINITNNNFSWKTSFNLTIPKNELVRYDNLEVSSNRNTYEIGKPLDLGRGFIFTGINAETGAPEFEDIDGDGTITYDGDKVTLGTTMPEFYGGLLNTIGYKNWNLNFLLQFVKKEAWGYKHNLFSPIGTQTNFGEEVYKRIIGGTGEFPKPTTYSSTWYDYIGSSATWGGASYIRLKNIYLSYTLGNNLTSKIGAKNCSLYLQGQNLITITNYKGLDPETTGLVTPPLRTYSIGINLTF